MNDYVRADFRIEPWSEDAGDLLAQMLADVGFESFVNDNPGTMQAYVRAADYSEAAVEQVVADFPMQAAVTYSVTLEKGRDWNEEWERHYFKPIVVGGRCVIHSSFHTDVPQAEHDIVIDPKMAFGTGHHATTSLMIGRLLELPVEGKAVTDVGTGSGILAILAAKLGAASVSAVEIDPPAKDNAVENAMLNGVADKIETVLGDAGALAAFPPADLLLANINRNIIIADLPRYADAMREGALAAFSGFYEEDVPMLAAAAAQAGLEHVDTRSHDRWACMLCRKLQQPK